VNPADLTTPGLTGLAGLGLTVLFLILMVAFRSQQLGGRLRLRHMPAFTRFGQTVGEAVEAGRRLYLALGSGGLNGLQGASGLMGLSILRRVAGIASVGDRPPAAASGEGALSVLSQDTLRSAFRELQAEDRFDPTLGQVTGLTPFSYAAGMMLELADGQAAAVLPVGHFGPEVGLITEACDRQATLTLGGSDSLPAQAVLAAAAQELLVGEELFAGGAYLNAGPAHKASLHAQDVIRWLAVGILVVGAILKLAGVL
jgi:hypothetical protein